MAAMGSSPPASSCYSRAPSWPWRRWRPLAVEGRTPRQWRTKARRRPRPTGRRQRKPTPPTGDRPSRCQAKLIVVRDVHALPRRHQVPGPRLLERRGSPVWREHRDQPKLAHLPGRPAGLQKVPACRQRFAEPGQRRRDRTFEVRPVHALAWGLELPRPERERKLAHPPEHQSPKSELPGSLESVQEPDAHAWRLKTKPCSTESPSIRHRDLEELGDDCGGIVCGLLQRICRGWAIQS